MDPGFAESFEKETWALFAVGVLAAILRIVARVKRLGMRGLQVDDYLIVAAVGFYTLLCVSLNQVVFGGGSNLLTDEEIAALTPESIKDRTLGSKWVFVSEHAMVLTIWALKAVMLLLYARVTNGTTQQRLVKYCAIYVALGFVGSELALFLICRPLHYYWAVPTPNPQCSTYQYYEIVQGILAITADILMLLIAIPLIISARLPVRQKAILVFIFGLGIFVIVSAILTKIYCLVPALISYDYMLWYFRESTVAMLVTCIPLMWSLFRDLFPSLTTRSGSSHETGATGYQLSKRKMSRHGVYQNADFESNRYDRRLWSKNEPTHDDLDMRLGGTTKVSASRIPGTDIPGSTSQEHLAPDPRDMRGHPLKIRRDITVTVTEAHGGRRDSDSSSGPHLGVGY